MKITKATIRKSTTDWMNAPYLSSTGSPFGLVPIVTASVEKFTPPVSTPTTGMMIASTSDETILPNAPPITTPTARSMTLPALRIP